MHPAEGSARVEPCSLIQGLYRSPKSPPRFICNLRFSQLKPGGPRGGRDTGNATQGVCTGAAHAHLMAKARFPKAGGVQLSSPRIEPSAPRDACPPSSQHAFPEVTQYPGFVWGYRAPGWFITRST